MSTNRMAVLVCLICAEMAFGDAQPQAVPTFHCVGLYWSPDDGAPDNVCRVRYRPAGVPSGARLCRCGSMSDRPRSCRRSGAGSIAGVSSISRRERHTRSSCLCRRRAAGVDLCADVERGFPHCPDCAVRNSVTPLIVDQSGSPEGYVLYGPRRAAELPRDHRRDEPACPMRRGSGLLRDSPGLTLKNAQQDGIRIFENCHDIVIEGCDISGWGRVARTAGARTMTPRSTPGIVLSSA